MPILGDKLKVKKLFSRGTLKEKEIKLVPHSGSPKDDPARGIKKYEVSKRPILGGKLKVKKLFSRGTLKEKEIKLGPHSGSPKG